jgi:2-methylisocitrate lyase-like PEP mutase family enzyme
MPSRNSRLRQLLSLPDFIVAPGCYDPISARLVEQAGFEAVYVTGGGISRASCFPDLGLLTMTEICAILTRIVDAVSIPVIADMDTGYGNAINVIRSVREFERSGISAFHLEDQVSPKKCGHYDGKEVISVREMVGKIKAAVDARVDRDLVIIARSDALAVEGRQAAIDRINTYLEAGADVGFVDAPRSAEDLAAIAGQVKGLSMVNMFEGGKTPVLPNAQLASMGFRIGIYPSQTQRAAVYAMREVLAILKKEGDASKMEGRLITFNEREQIIDTASWRAREEAYLRPQSEN